MTQKKKKTLHSNLQTSVNRASTSHTKALSRSNFSFYLSVAVALLIFAVYLPSLKNGFIGGWDDNAYVVENVFIRSIGWDLLRWAFTDTYIASYWHPLTWISHAIDYSIWGLNPLGHHLSNVIIHAVNSGIVVWLTIKLLYVISENGKTASNMLAANQLTVFIAAAVTGLLFGLHPMKVESVAWVAQRKDLLYSMFFLLSIVIYIRYVHTQTKNGGHPFYLTGSYYVTLLLFLLSLCSKPMAITLPAVLLLLDWYPMKRISSYKDLPALLIEKLPFILSSALISVISLVSQKAGSGLTSLEDAAFPVRILIACKGVMLYFWNMIVPLNLLPFYYYPKDVSLAKPEYVAAILLVSAITAWCVYTAKKQPLWLTVWLFFLVTLFPVLGFFQAGAQSMADRYVYIPSLSLFMLLGTGVAWCWTRAGSSLSIRRIVQPLIAASVIAVAICLSYVTIKQLNIWQNDTTFWDSLIVAYSKAIDARPNDESFYIKRGKLLYNEKKFDLAMKDFNKAIELKPDSAETFAHRGNVYLKMGQIEQAIKEYDRSISLRPDEYPAYINRGIAYEDKGELDKALKDFSTGISIKPGQATLYIGRADIYMKIGTVDLAIRDYQKACDLGNKLGCSKAFFPFDKSLVEAK